MKQNIWGRLAAANFIIGGTGIGVYLVSFLQALVVVGSSAFSEPMPFGLISPLMVSIGFIFLGVEAGRPLKGRFAFYRPRRSWISRETIAFGIFIPSATLELIIPHPSLRLLAVIAALGLLISQGFIVYHARAVTAWNVPILPIFFITSNLASGFGLLLILMALGGLFPDQSTYIIGFIIAGFNLVIWCVYIIGSRSTLFFSATRILRHTHSLILTVGLGHVIPLLLLLILLIPQSFFVDSLLCFFAAISGALLCIGNASQKVGVIISSGYLRDVKLGH